ncbi:unnamed protein product (macronuclear) [Paramecium tetraurelia]|uniref:Uncharacterized protein n=1 Tax=Paramecium tetraurelia TaxID=5888 RepID=A0DH80_PARTE|nr:uncharacterized protein GSPATT00016783001 [Paramecium tetraurelia]CAK82397.1 unnamed protein product [Paramecium tetraurelia]|eukprot:XP_001449794.1 hypothetical protein (macronuclear) [Paramecium tetraurelia strain d4-2]
MGNSAAKLNRKFDHWISKAHNFIFKASQGKDPQLVIDHNSQGHPVDQNIEQHQNQGDQQQEAQSIDDNLNENNYESLILTSSITKDESNSDKRKASYQLVSESESKRVCVNQDYVIIDE